MDKSHEDSNELKGSTVASFGEHSLKIAGIDVDDYTSFIARLKTISASLQIDGYKPRRISPPGSKYPESKASRDSSKAANESDTAQNNVHELNSR